MRKLNRDYYPFFFTLLQRDEVSMGVEQPFDFGYGELFADGTRGREEYVLKQGVIIKRSPIRYKPHLHVHGECVFHQLIGTFTPFRKMYKDFSDTFQPYFTQKKIKKDLIQPLTGVINVVDGFIFILAGLAVVLFLFIPSLCMYSACHASDRFSHIGTAVSWLIYGVANIIRGITQVVSTPLTYFIKIPLRMTITFFKKRQNTLTTIENKPEIQRLVRKAQHYLSMAESEQAQFIDYPFRNTDIVMRLVYEIHRKFKRSHRDGWDTGINNFADFDNLFKQIFKGYYEKVEWKLGEEVTYCPPSNRKKEISISFEEKEIDFESVSTYLKFYLS